MNFDNQCSSAKKPSDVDETRAQSKNYEVSSAVLLQPLVYCRTVLVRIYVWVFKGGFLVCKNSISFALATMLVATLMAKQAMAEVIQIEFTQFDTFSIEVANIGVGDTVEWLPKNKGHNVEFLAGPNMADLPPKSSMNEFHSVRFEKQGVYLYGCTPHLNMGMLGLIVVGNDMHNINEIGNTDLPNVAESVLLSLIQEAQSSAKSD